MNVLLYFLQLNADKTEVLIIAPDNVSPIIKQSHGPLSSGIHSNLPNLGVTFDQSPSFDAHC